MPGPVFQSPDQITAMAARAIVTELPEGPLKLANVSTPLPAAVSAILREVLAVFSEGGAVSLVPKDAEFSPAEAAEFLNVSRGFVTKLMDEGQLSYREVGSHRRIPAPIVVAYDEAQRLRARAALAEIAGRDQDMGLYDEAPMLNRARNRKRL